MTAINLTPEKGFLTGLNNFWEYNIGKVEKNVPKMFSLLLKDAQHHSIRFGCSSCTTGKSAQKENDIQIDITYKATDAKGVKFIKTVTETLQDGTQVIIRFNGEIV